MERPSRRAFWPPQDYRRVTVALPIVLGRPGLPVAAHWGGRLPTRTGRGVGTVIDRPLWNGADCGHCNSAAPDSAKEARNPLGRCFRRVVADAALAATNSMPAGHGALIAIAANDSFTSCFVTSRWQCCRFIRHRTDKEYSYALYTRY